jgi:hypothetical protein
VHCWRRPQSGLSAPPETETALYGIPDARRNVGDFSPKEQAEMLRGLLQEGRYLGRHASFARRMSSSRLRPVDRGREQQFGVVHKERLKH